MTAVIEARELRKSFPGRRDQPIEAVRGVSLQVARGEIVGFLGPNGAGKTTTLRMLTTLLPIDGGSAEVAGLDVRRQPGRVRARIGYVSQLGGADELATGRENLTLQGRLYGGRRGDVARRVGKVLEQFDLAGFADRRVRTYSGGQRRRLDVALGVVHEPEVLFLDEPSTGLDPQNRASLWDHIRGLRDRGTTVFLTTHYLDEADVLCDRIMIIDHGTVVAQGTPRALKQQVAGDAIVLVTRDADTAGLAAAELAGQPGVRDLTVDAAAVRMYASDGAAALPGLLRLLDRAGAPVRSLRLSEPSLDDVFLRQTGRSLRDAGDPAAPAPDRDPPDQGVPDQDASDQDPPDHGTPDHGGPDHGGPDHGAPDHGAPDHGAPDHGAPDHGAPDHGAPDHGDAEAVA
jgi:ABC-2 type transport system ATP-binding protein